MSSGQDVFKRRINLLRVLAKEIRLDRANAVPEQLEETADVLEQVVEPTPEPPTEMFAQIERCKQRAHQDAIGLSNALNLDGGGMMHTRGVLERAMMFALVLGRHIGDGTFPAPAGAPAPCVWRLSVGSLGTWVQASCLEGWMPAPWGTDRAKACHLCGHPLTVER